MTYTNFCDRFSAMRKERNLSQNTLAKELNVTRKTVGDWESSRSSSVCMITLSLYSLNFEMSMQPSSRLKSASETNSNGLRSTFMYFTFSIGFLYISSCSMHQLKNTFMFRI
ncbi:helix-turn-helix domain-containing protein [uncultured Gemmiger sp.]|uniref:helix-turn-helix domain-containing protein n=1 Tax=uncultured Gemmiger sp. TaxID=1623490 RepID=UPI0035A66EED